MASQVITIENLKKTLDSLEKDGVVCLLLSTEKDGTALVPSEKKPFYRIPVIMSEDFTKESNLSLMLGGMYIVPIRERNLGSLSDLATKAYEANKGE